MYCCLGGASEFASCPGAAETSSAAVDLSGNDGVAVGAAGANVGAAVPPTPSSASHGVAAKAKPKRRLSCKTSDIPDKPMEGLSATKTWVPSPDLAAPRRRLKRSAAVAGFTERSISFPQMDSNIMLTSAGGSIGDFTSVSTVPVIEASPRHRIMRTRSSSAVHGSAGMTGDRDDAASPGDAVMAETQQEQDRRVLIVNELKAMAILEAVHSKENLRRRVFFPGDGMAKL